METKSYIVHVGHGTLYGLDSRIACLGIREPMASKPTLRLAMETILGLSSMSGVVARSSAKSLQGKHILSR